ncbi:MAG: hypothetical protein AAF631_11655 [Pseudomonadota bacterium]
MKRLGTALAAATVALGACGAPSPNDGAQYFDNITPTPSNLQAEATRLAAAETTGPLPRAPQEPPSRTAAISNTQDFGAIQQQETIASDAAKRERLRETYEVVAPEALPEAPAGPNLAAYAISQKHAVGTRTYRRFNIGISNCGQYRGDPDKAQRAFLAAGGPERDRKRLDPDGDGFACDWNPDTYRRLISATKNG